MAPKEVKVAKDSPYRRTRESRGAVAVTDTLKEDCGGGGVDGDD
ncbi:hypothetical protein COLO4_29820 [Corchorus olitorius]|uniref:Uncharacterized protein n=1 Tax=Corchorus olitorius TaxID=93759 RepID=A0A1R3HD02_9ROSI|nr:hypothetical protein COLO4_29820 [Corchorus olitorius]